MKPTIYVANTSANSVLANGQIPFNQVVRRYGNIINLFGSDVRLLEPGYYYIDASATFTTPTAGDATITLRQDGVDVVGGSATETVSTTTQVKTVDISAVVRVFCGQPSVISLFNTGVAVDVTAASMVVTKL